MPDITKCTNSACMMCTICYRYTCEPSFLQSFSKIEPKINSNKGFICDWFIPINESNLKQQPNGCYDK